MLAESSLDIFTVNVALIPFLKLLHRVSLDGEMFGPMDWV